jgi:KRAB domain-containing zinc finger protein
MSEMKEIKIEPNCNDKKQTDNVDIIVNNIKKEREVEFVLILPPREVKIESIEDVQNEVQEQNETQKHKKKFQCTQCPKSFETQKSLYKHKRAHEPKVKCQICNKKLRKGYLKDHLKTHEAIKFNCDHCSAGFVTKGHLVRHMWTHRSDKRFNCTQCNREFNKSFELKAHLLSHSNNPRPLQCDLCPKNYATKRQIKEHLIAIHSEQRFQCDKCDFTAKWKRSLSNHKKRHSKSKPFSCQFCEKKFKSKQQLQNHQTVHTTAKDFECKTCGKMFGSQKILQAHEKNVHGKDFVFVFASNLILFFSFFIVADKKFACSKCPKVFKAQIYLKKHENRHLNL